MADNNLELAATLVKLGESADKANEDSIKFGKAIDQSGTALGRNYDHSSEELAPLAIALVTAIGKKPINGIVLDASYYLRTPACPQHEAILLQIER